MHLRGLPFIGQFAACNSNSKLLHCFAWGRVGPYNKTIVIHLIKQFNVMILLVSNKADVWSLEAGEEMPHLTQCHT